MSRSARAPNVGARAARRQPEEAEGAAAEGGEAEGEEAKEDDVDDIRVPFLPLPRCSTAASPSARSLLVYTIRLPVTRTPSATHRASTSSGDRARTGTRNPCAFDRSPGNSVSKRSDPGQIGCCRRDLKSPPLNDGLGVEHDHAFLLPDGDPGATAEEKAEIRTDDHPATAGPACSIEIEPADWTPQPGAEGTRAAGRGRAAD